MVFVLFPDEAPRAAKNYRQLFTGEKVRQAVEASVDAAPWLGTGVVDCLGTLPRHETATRCLCRAPCQRAMRAQGSPIT